ncbi:MAG: tripartite tricarboxylate transporter substrate binding protein [Proteobacteria bacterium]|nr:tripartite tricarboxylate transporter substrate binding protein [Pseudomonadota bacterium]
MAAALPAVAAESAATYPSKPIRIMGQGAGSTADYLSRFLGQKLTERWGQPVIVENKSGGNTVIATDAVAKAAPDGHTLLLTAMPFALNPLLIDKLPYDSANDLVPVTLLTTIPNILAIHPDFPAKNMKELIDAARANPGSVSFASTGQATSTHLSAELFAKMANVKLTHVPYRGSAPAHQDVLSGRVPIMFDNGMLQHIKAAKMRAIGVTSATRVPWLPDVPTIAEQGLTGYDAVAWYGIFATGGTKPEIIGKLATDITWAIRSADIATKLTAMGANAEGGTPEQFRQYLANEVSRWGGLVKELGLKAD